MKNRHAISEEEVRREYLKHKEQEARAERMKANAEYIRQCQRIYTEQKI